MRYRAALYWIRKGQRNKVYGRTGSRISDKVQLQKWKMITWQSDWDASDTGRRVCQVIPCVRERLARSHVNAGEGMGHSAMGHGPDPAYLHRFGKTDNVHCQCGQIGTPEHIIMDCRTYNALRNPFHMQQHRRASIIHPKPRLL